MSDIEPPRGSSLIPIDSEIKREQRNIQIAEKESVIAGLNQRLKDLESVQAKKIKLQMEILNKEIKFLKQQNDNSVVEGEFKEK